MRTTPAGNGAPDSDGLWLMDAAGAAHPDEQEDHGGGDEGRPEPEQRERQREQEAGLGSDG